MSVSSCNSLVALPLSLPLQLPHTPVLPYAPVCSSNANAPQHTFETLSIECELEVLQDGVDGVVLLQERRLQVADLGVVERLELFERLDDATCGQLVQSEGC